MRTAKTLACVTVLSLVPALAPTLAHAQGNNLYISGTLGANFASETDYEADFPGTFPDINGSYDFGTGFGLTAALGYSFDMFRFEGEIGYQGFNGDEFTVSRTAGGQTSTLTSDGEISATTFMANGLVDLPVDLGLPLTPYIGGGAGIALVDVGGDESDSAFAYQFRAGLGYALSDRAVIDFGYRYLGLGETEHQNGAVTLNTDSFNAHIFEVGARIGF